MLSRTFAPALRRTVAAQAARPQLGAVRYAHVENVVNNVGRLSIFNSSTLLTHGHPSSCAELPFQSVTPPRTHCRACSLTPSSTEYEGPHAKKFTIYYVAILSVSGIVRRGCREQQQRTVLTSDSFDRSSLGSPWHFSCRSTTMYSYKELTTDPVFLHSHKGGSDS